jgi:hypothetical protein
MSYTASYSPEDNKLRFYSSSRLDRDLYVLLSELFGVVFQRYLA